MAAFSPATHKAVVSSTQNPKDDLRIDTRDLLTRLFIDMGLFRIVAGNAPPASRDDLWWHIDVRQVKRWDGVQMNWFQATPNQIAMHIHRRTVLGSVTDTTAEAGDLFTFWDVSAGDVKVISRENLAATLLGSLTTTEGIQGGGAQSGARTLKLDINGLTPKTLPSGADKLALYSAADSAHRASTVNQLAAGITESDYLHSELFFYGSMS